MVIFHSYLSLPEGNPCTPRRDVTRARRMPRPTLVLRQPKSGWVQLSLGRSTVCPEPPHFFHTNSWPIHDHYHHYLNPQSSPRFVWAFNASHWKILKAVSQIVFFCSFSKSEPAWQRGQGLSTAKGQFMVSTLLRNAGSVDLCSLHSCDAPPHCCTAGTCVPLVCSLAQDLWAKIRAEQNRHNTYVPQKKHVYTQTYIFRTYVYIYIMIYMYTIVYRYTHTRINTHTNSK